MEIQKLQRALHDLSSFAEGSFSVNTSVQSPPKQYQCGSDQHHVLKTHSSASPAQFESHLLSTQPRKQKEHTLRAKELLEDIHEISQEEKSFDRRWSEQRNNIQPRFASL